MLRTFWCIEHKGPFVEDDRHGGRRTTRALCRECTQEILKNFLKRSDALRIYEQYEGEFNRKRRYYRRGKSKEATKEVQAEAETAAESEERQSAGEPRHTSEEPATGVGVRPPPPKKTGKRGPRPLDAATDDVPVKGEPLQADLPGMEDREIKELEALAQNYASIRDRRMALNKSEIELKTTLLALMHKYEKETYSRDGIDIKVVHEEESVKVRVHHDEE